MEPDAVRRASTRLRGASKELTSMCEHRDNFQEFEVHWYNFLANSDSFFDILKAGTKKQANSILWHDTVLERRCQDELLFYVYKARNSETHSIQDSFSRRPPNQITFMIFVGDDGQVKRRQNDELMESLSSLPKCRFELRDITDRGKTIPTPSQHKGLYYISKSPIYAAHLFLEFMNEVLSEAQKL